MRKGLVTVIVLLVVLGGAAVVADRVGLRVAQNEIAKNVAAQYGMDHDPKVTIKGFPFITQALEGRYDEIDVDMGEVTQEGVRLTGAAVTLKDVTAPLSDAMHGDATRMVAGTATSTATVAYKDVDKEAPRGMKVSADGPALRVRGPVTVLGLTRTVTATVTVQPAGRSVRVVPQSVTTGGTRVPLALVRQAFTFTMPVHGLPLGTRLSAVDVLPGGLRVSATAQDVKLSSLNTR